MADTMTCPLGHTVPIEHVRRVDGQLVCPVCAGAGWPAPPRPRSWSWLAIPLWLVAVGQFAAAGAELLALAGYANGLHLTTSAATVDAYLLTALGDLLVGIGAAAAAIGVRR